MLAGLVTGRRLLWTVSCSLPDRVPAGQPGQHPVHPGRHPGWFGADDGRPHAADLWAQGRQHCCRLYLCCCFVHGDRCPTPHNTPPPPQHASPPPTPKIKIEYTFSGVGFGWCLEIKIPKNKKRKPASKKSRRAFKTTGNVSLKSLNL